MAIEEAEARVQIRLTELKGKEEEAKAQYNIKMLEGKRIRDYNKLIIQGITPDLITLRRLELREKELEKWNGTLPQTLLTNGADIPVIIDATKK